MNFKVKNSFLPVLAFALSIILWTLSCSKPLYFLENQKEIQTKELILAWNNLYLELDRFTYGYFPPVSSRNFSFISLTAYEVVNTDVQNFNLNHSYFNGLSVPAKPVNIEIEHAIALNCAYASIFRSFFPTAPPERFIKIDELEQKIEKSFHGIYSGKVILESKKYGNSVANAVYLWSSLDIVGHEAYNNLYETNTTLPGRRDSWTIAQTDSKRQLLPNWGKVRPFILDINSIKVNEPLPYSEKPNSKMYQEALAIYTMSMPLSDENKWIAEFWSDDHRGITFSPAARWVSITNQLVNSNKISCHNVLELYLKLGISMADGLIIGWKAKYMYNQERPSQYINRVINKNWRPFHENPNFPSYPSGHSILGAAASIILNKYFGENCNFTDKSHENRQEFIGKPRSFSTFKEMAFESAYSRNALGVHTRNECEEGLRVGFIIGQKICDLPISEEELAVAEIKY